MTLRWLPALACGLLAVGLGACGEDPTPTPPARVTIAVISDGGTGWLAEAMHAGALRAADDLGVDVAWSDPADAAAQAEQVAGAIADGAAGIAVAPIDLAAVEAVLTQAATAGIPVVVLHAEAPSGRFLAANTGNGGAGNEAGRYIADAIEGRGGVAVLRPATMTETAQARQEGFRRAISRQQGIQTLTVEPPVGAGVGQPSPQQEVERQFEQFLAQSSDAAPLRAVFAATPELTRLALDVLEGLRPTGRTDGLLLVGFGGDPDLVAALEAGQVEALVVERPEVIGYEGVKLLVSRLRGENVEGRVETGWKLVNRDNLAEPQVQVLLHPDLSVLTPTTQATQATQSTQATQP